MSKLRTMLRSSPALDCTGAHPLIELMMIRSRLRMSY